MLYQCMLCLMAVSSFELYLFTSTKMFELLNYLFRSLNCIEQPHHIYNPLSSSFSFAVTKVISVSGEHTFLFLCRRFCHFKNTPWQIHHTDNVGFMGHWQKEIIESDSIVMLAVILNKSTFSWCKIKMPIRICHPVEGIHLFTAVTTETEE